MSGSQHVAPKRASKIAVGAKAWGDGVLELDRNLGRLVPLEKISFCINALHCKRGLAHCGQ